MTDPTQSAPSPGDTPPTLPAPPAAATATARLHPGVGLAVAVWAIYTAGMALAWLVTDNDYAETAEVLKDIWWVLLILVVAMWVIVRLSGLQVQRSWRLGWLLLVLIVPVGLALLGAVLLFAVDGADWTTVLIVLATTMLVGIGEETAFRGLVLNSLATRIPVAGAVFVSAILFGLMHSVNAIIQPVGSTIVQVVVTGLYGVIFGFVYVTSGGNLVLVIVLHWLYDFSLIAPMATKEGENPFGIVGLLMLLSFAIALAVGVAKYHDVKRWPEPTS